MTGDESGKPTFSADDLALVEATPEQRRAELLVKLHSPSGLTEAEVAEYDCIARAGRGGGADSTPTPPVARSPEDAAFIREFAQKMHTDTMEAQRWVQEHTPRYDALRRDERPATAPAKSTASKAKDAVVKMAHDITRYLAAAPPRTDGQQRGWADDRIIGKLVPIAHKHGISPEQFEAFIKDVIAAEPEIEAWREEESDEALAEAEKVAREAAEEALAKRFGPRWRDRLEPTNQYLRKLLPGGKSKELMETKLADGTALGAHPLVVEAFIEVACDLGRRR